MWSGVWNILQELSAHLTLSLLMGSNPILIWLVNDKSEPGKEQFFGSLWNLSSCNLRVHPAVHHLFSGSLISSLEHIAAFFTALWQPSHNYKELQMQGFTKSGKTHKSDLLLIQCALRLQYLTVHTYIENVSLLGDEKMRVGRWQTWARDVNLHGQCLDLRGHQGTSI